MKTYPVLDKTDTLGIPDTEYDALVATASSEFTRIVRDLSQLGESVRIEAGRKLSGLPARERLVNDVVLVVTW
jgi:proliferating cell nuclear antigen